MFLLVMKATGRVRLKVRYSSLAERRRDTRDHQGRWVLYPFRTQILPSALYLHQATYNMMYSIYK